MAGTRASARNQNSSSAPNTPEKRSPGQKRKAADSSPASSRGRKQQKTLEETAPDDSDMKEATDKVEAAKSGAEDKKTEAEANRSEKQDTQPDVKQGNANGESEQDTNGDKGEEENPAPESKEDEKDTKAKSTEGGAVEQSAERGEKMPSNILEKGIFYFFARARVGVDNPQSVQDIARSYLVLRPLPKDAKLTDGPVDDLRNNRVLALPKKVMPKGHRDAFMTFVEKGQTSIEDLKEDFLGGSEYNTKTTGVRHTPPATPLVEGVYAITDTGRTTHFAYVVTIPEKISEVQKDMGFRARGSFVMSLKNPEQQGPANASLPQKPDWPEEMQQEFRGLRWMPVQPRFIDYASAQFLLIGEGRDELGKATEVSERDEKHNKETPEEEINALEDEDSHRTGQLHGEDSVFDDLGISSKDYPKIKSTW